MANLVLTAENYAFGPIGKLLYIADLLRDGGHTLTFVGFGTSFQLARKFPFDAIYEIDTDNPESVSASEAVISKGDVVISSMDPVSVMLAKKLKKPVVYIDCLFWFWDNIPKEVFDVDLYIQERSLNDRVNYAKYSIHIKNLYSVGPIIGNVRRLRRKNQALISFGGGQATYYYQVSKDTNYPFIMTNILLKHFDWSNFERVLLATSESIVEELKKRFSNRVFEFATIAHDKFLEEISQSEILLTTPGLITSQAAFYLKTPTVFLPPSNDSQYLQLEEFRRLNLAPASIGLDDFMPKLNLFHIPVEESTKLVLSQLRELEQSQDIQTKIGIGINKLIQNRKVWSKESIKNGRKFIDSLGGNSAQKVADKIMQLLSSRDFGAWKNEKYIGKRIEITKRISSDDLQKYRGSSIDILIPAHNSAKSIGRVIENLASQVIPKNSRLCIIVCANACVDDTAKVAEDALKQVSLKNKKVSSLLVATSQPGEPQAINRMLTETSNEIVVVVNDDVEPSHNSLVSLYVAMRDYPQIGAVSVPSRPLSNFVGVRQSLPVRIANQISKLYLEKDITIVGRMYAFRKSIVSHFPNILSEDNYLTYMSLLKSYGYGIIKDGHSYVYYKPSSTHDDVLAQTLSHSLSGVQFFREYPDALDIFINIEEQMELQKKQKGVEEDQEICDIAQEIKDCCWAVAVLIDKFEPTMGSSRKRIASTI